MSTQDATQNATFASVDACYSCGKCTAGCPMADRMDYAPHRIFRLIQMGNVDVAARSEAIWLCVSCYTCSARCPQSVRCVTALDGLREKALAEGLVPPEQERVLRFQRTFLENVRRHGRVNELELMARFKMVGFFKNYSMPLLFKDADLVPKLAERGKLSVLPKRASDRALVDRIFERCGFNEPAEPPEGESP